MGDRSRNRRARRGAAGVAVCLVCVLAAASATAKRPALPGPDSAFDQGALEAGEPRVDGQLLVDADSLARGETASIGVLLRTAPGWHVYWRNPGGSGLPTRVELRVDGEAVGPLFWPAPRTYRDGAELLVTYGYEGEALLWADATLQGEGPGPVLVEATVDLLACKELCIPARLELELPLEVTAGGGRNGRAPLGDPRVRQLFDRFAGQLPRPPEELGVKIELVASQSAVRPGDHFELAVAVARCAPADAAPCPELVFDDPDRSVFVPEQLPTVDLRVEGARHHPDDLDRLAVGVFGSARPQDPAVDLQKLRGLLAVEVAGQFHYVEVDLPLPRAAADSEVEHHAAFPLLVADVGPPRGRSESFISVSLLQAVWLAFLGGLILNLMPCVLPILAIKIFAVAEIARSGRREILLQGAAYTAGIILSLLALASLVVLMRSAGRSVGWGFQFQEPLFVAVVSAVLVVFALNLFGVFDIGSPRLRLGVQVSGPRRGFFEGLLAVVLATPCSAPFLATAVGFAFASETIVIYAIFASVGLGFAAPFVLVTLAPGLARVVPASGPWMEQLRRALGFPLLATVVWLLWVAGRSLEFDSVVWLLSYLLAVAFATWLYGVVQHGERSAWLRGAGPALAGLAVVGLLMLPLVPRSDHPTRSLEGGIAWQRFSPESVELAVRSGQPVFVGFTADWCITCKANENLVLAREDIAREFERLGVAAFLADWTRRDEAIRAELARFGKAGVPMYLVYSPSDPTFPDVLPEILTADRVIAAVRDAAAGRVARRSL